MLTANVVKSVTGFAAFAAMQALSLEANGEALLAGASSQTSDTLTPQLDRDPLVFEPLGLGPGSSDAKANSVVNVSQSGASNEIDVWQAEGVSFVSAQIVQSGEHMTAEVVQNGSGNQAKVEQVGEDNLLALAQSGLGNLLHAEQVGQGLSIEINQAGGSALIVKQWNY